jgi:uncharacterized protein
LVADLLSKFEEPHRIAIELHGGEPLLYPREKFYELANIFLTHSTRINRLTIQTNATLLNSDWVDFLMACFPNIQIGISDDAMHEIESYRLDYSEASANTSIRRSLTMLSQRGIGVGCICVVTDKSIERADDIMEHLSSFNCIKVVKFVPCYDYQVSQGVGPLRRSGLGALLKIGPARLPWTISPSEYTSFLRQVWTNWVQRKRYNQFVIEPFLSILKKISGGSTTNCHFSGTKCAHVFTLYPDGLIGGCDELDKDFSIYGQLPSVHPTTKANDCWTSDIDSTTQQLTAQCLSCSYLDRCGGGCMAVRRRLSLEHIDSAYCTHRREIIDFVEGEWKKILGHERDNHLIN